MIDFRSHYRVVKRTWYDGSFSYQVHRRRWFSPFWKHLQYPSELHHIFCDVGDDQEQIRTDFDSPTAAENFAKQHALQGNRAFYKTRYTLDITELGKLP